MTTPSDPGQRIVEGSGLVRDYPSGDSVVHALRGVDLAVGRGQLVCVQGRSGSGKTTLLNLLGGLDRPTAGRVVLDGQDLTAMGERELVEVRRRSVGYIFQAFGLLPILSAAENVEVPLRLVRAGYPRARGPRPGSARAGRSRRARRPSAARAFRWRAAACRHRPRSRESSAPRAGRRANRPTRLRDRPPDHAAASLDRAGGGDHRGGRDPRSADARCRGSGR